MRRALVILALLILPGALRAQATAAETCKDGTTSTVTGKGACSHHGGVDKKATAKATANAKASTKAPTKESTKKADRAAKGGPITYRPPVSAPIPSPVNRDPMPAPTATPAPAPRSTAPRTTATGPAGASAQCKDGTYSYSKTRRGTCSHHGGVSTWMGLAK